MPQSDIRKKANDEQMKHGLIIILNHTILMLSHVLLHACKEKRYPTVTLTHEK